MDSIANGMALCKIHPFAAGVFIFSDYCRPAMRLAALMEITVTFIYTHDSIGVGEDGPTHQPVEQLASLHAIPGLITMRPADANEVVEAWKIILQTHREPIALIMSRQNRPTLDRSFFAPTAGLAQGAYVFYREIARQPQVILIASGTEVHLCLEASEQLKGQGVDVRVVSMPSWELFEQQPQAYHDQVFPPQVTARVVVEQASTFGWERYVGITGSIVGIKTFGASAPLKELQTKFGFTAGAAAAAAQVQLDRAHRAAA